MKVLIYSDSDYKADRRTLKKKNNSKEITEEEFKQYIKDNNLIISYGYMDSSGNISNGQRFRCYLLTDIGTHIPVGVSGIVKELMQVEE